jgi:ferredoxin
MRDGTRLRLRVDPVACDTYGYCAELLPERITLDEWGYPIVDGAPPARRVDRAGTTRGPRLPAEGSDVGEGARIALVRVTADSTVALATSRSARASISHTRTVPLVGQSPTTLAGVERSPRASAATRAG